MTLALGVIREGGLKVQIEGVFREFQLFRRQPEGSVWEQRRDTALRPGDIAIMRTERAAYHGYLIRELRGENVHLHHVTLLDPTGRCQAMVNWQTTMTPSEFASDVYRVHRLRGLALAESLSIAVAVVAGVGVGAGFGPLAGFFGLQAAGGAGTSVLVGGVAGALSTFIHQNFLAMQEAVRRDQRHGAAHYWLANTTNFTEILTNTLISGVYGGTTALIPGPRDGVSSTRALATLLVNRLGNHLANVMQAAVTEVWVPAMGGQVPSIAQIRKAVAHYCQTGLTRDVLVRALG
jgi:hypothetical protein